MTRHRLPPDVDDCRSIDGSDAIAPLAPDPLDVNRPRRHEIRTEAVTNPVWTRNPTYCISLLTLPNVRIPAQQPRCHRIKRDTGFGMHSRILQTGRRLAIRDAAGLRDGILQGPSRRLLWVLATQCPCLGIAMESPNRHLAVFCADKLPIWIISGAISWCDNRGGQRVPARPVVTQPLWTLADSRLVHPRPSTTHRATPAAPTMMTPCSGPCV
jgi:hypothetical protein